METIAGIAIALVSAAGGVTADHFFRGWREARRGRKDEAQRVASERDKAREQRDSERYERMKWRDLAFRIRLRAMQEGVDPSRLPDMPD